MRLLLTRFRTLLAVTLFVALTAPVCAQQPEIERLAADLAGKFSTTEVSETENTRIAVIPFVRSQGQITDLGALLADQIAKLMAEQKKGVEVTGPEQIQTVIADEKLTKDVLLDPRVCSWLAKKIGANVFFIGLLEREQNGFHLTVRAVRVLDGKEMAASEERFSTTPEYEKLFATERPGVPTGIPKEVSSSPKAEPRFKPGRDGTTYPECSFCPAPRFSDEARKIKYKGTVLLSITVTPEGRASEISIVRGLPFDLNKSALEIIQTWRFEPSRDRGGNAVPVQILIEMSFRIPG